MLACTQTKQFFVDQSNLKRQKAQFQRQGYCRLQYKTSQRFQKIYVNRILKLDIRSAASLDSDQTVQQSNVDSNTYKCVIVGGGITGLCSGLALKQQHGIENFVITEQRKRVGGNITTVSDDKFLWEEGPNSFTPSDPVLQAAVDAGVADELVLGDPTAPRFVFWEGILRQVPAGILSGITTNLLSPWGKIRLGLGAVGILKSPPPEGVEESVEQFIKRNLGDEMFYRLIEPFCSGVYAGNPANLGMKAAFGRIQVLEEKGGSLVGGALKLMQERKANPPPPRNPELPPKPAGQTVGSFKNGLKMLPEAIAQKLDQKIRLNWTLNKISKPGSEYQLTYSTPEGDITISTESVLLTVPSYVASSLLSGISQEASEALKQIDYPPVAAVTLAYPISDVREERKETDGFVPGFGQLHPRTQGIITLGTIYSSSLFPGRAPEKMILTLNYIGGATNRKILDMSEDEIVKQVDQDVRKMLIKDDAGPPVVVGVRVWPRAIPQFNVGHLDIIETAQKGLKAAGYESLFLGGNYVYGVALGKCMEASYDMAKTIADFVAKSTQ